MKFVKIRNYFKNIADCVRAIVDTACDYWRDGDHGLLLLLLLVIAPFGILCALIGLEPK